MVECKIACTQKCWRIATAIMQVIGAVLLVFLGVIRFVWGQNLEFPITWLLSFYYFLFAILLILGELQFRFYMKYMVFLYYSWGKGIVNIMISTYCLQITLVPFFQIPVAVYFFVLGIIYIVLGCVFRKIEMENAKKVK
jgi:hypothetical protein